MTSMRDKLLPCPFCGELPAFEKFDGDGDDGDLFQIVCGNGCATHENCDRDEIIKGWNTRTLADRLTVPEDVEGLVVWLRAAGDGHVTMEEAANTIEALSARVRELEEEYEVLNENLIDAEAQRDTLAAENARLREAKTEIERLAQEQGVKDGNEIARLETENARLREALETISVLTEREGDGFYNPDKTIDTVFEAARAALQERG